MGRMRTAVPVLLPLLLGLLCLEGGESGVEGLQGAVVATPDGTLSSSTEPPPASWVLALGTSLGSFLAVGWA